MIEVYLFDLPIYRLPQDQYNSECEAFQKRKLREVDPDGTMGDGLVMRFTDNLWRQFGGPWRYNEIDGFVRLFILGDQIRGELWRTEAKRRSKSRKKQFYWIQGKPVPEVSLPSKGKNGAIAKAIEAYIELWEQELSPRIVDREQFDTLAAYVDWNGLIKEAELSLLRQVRQRTAPAS